MPLLYQLKRTRRRRSIMLQVDSSGSVTVLAPRWTLRYFIEKFVQERADWIQEKLKAVETQRNEHPPKQLTTGESFLVWGNDVPLTVNSAADRAQIVCEMREGRLQLMEPTTEGPQTVLRQAALQQWYRQQTENRLRQRIPFWAECIGVTPGKVVVANQKKRWGSCSPKGNLRFNWRLSMMPEAICDYVIVHELAHIRSHDHSKQFWSVVQAAQPEYKIHRRWLREHGHRLTIE